MRTDSTNALPTLAPDALETLIRRIAAGQTPGDRSAVSMYAIVDALAVAAHLGDGPVGWRRRVGIQRAVIDAVADIEGLQFVEADV
ncbi:MAG: hypothetical protein GX649_12735 [Chloroflexi bacterium]|nr:hypothetical protein [Chloroflexota bacterium]